MIFTAIAAGSILCIPLSGDGTGKMSSIVSYGIGALFWASFILGQIMFWMANRSRKGIERYLKRNGMKVLNPCRPGIVSLFQNKEAVIADIVFIISVLATAASVIFSIGNEWIILSSVSLLFLSLNLHCLFNGLNYKYIDFVRKNSKRR